MAQYDDEFRAEFRHGSAAWSNRSDIRDAGLLKPQGLHVGYWEQKPLYMDGDAPLITFGGAGSGKMRDILAYVVCNTPGQRMIMLDPRGEAASISAHVHAPRGDHAYCWNPTGLCDLPWHACNPLDVLDPNRPTFISDIDFVTEALIASTGSKEGAYFETHARLWLGAIIADHCDHFGSITLPRLKAVVNQIESDGNAWAETLERMLTSHYGHVRSAAGEMLVKQQEAEREFAAIMGTMYGALKFLNDPSLQDALEEPDFSLADLTNPTKPVKVFLNVPAEFLGIWAPLLRLFFTVGMLFKGREPAAPRILLLVDEAGQLGKFDALLRAFTFGRGAGIRAWAIFQDIGQVERHFGKPALQSFIGSAQVRQFIGTRDVVTAKLISDMLGSETGNYVNEQREEEAKRQKEAAFLDMFLGNADPFQAAETYSQQERIEARRDKQTRPLLTPEEILTLSEDRQILFVSGKNLNPILAWKYPYFTRREMAGLYLPNPYHPPTDKVKIKGRFRPTWAEIVAIPMPERFAGFPKLKNSIYRYVKGFKL